MAHTLDEVQAELATQKSEITNLGVLVQSLKDKIVAMSDIQAKIDALFDTATSNTADIKAIANQSSAQI